MSLRARFEYSPGSPTSPTSVASALDTLLDDGEDVLEWAEQWEQRSSNMDQKHVEILISHWRLMRDAAREHSQAIHQMKQAMHELRANGLTVQDRMDSLERRLRDDLKRDQERRLVDLETRLVDGLRQSQSDRLDVLGRQHESRLDDLKGSIREDVGAALGPRLEALEARLKDDVSMEQAVCLEGLERRLRERLLQEQAIREAEGAELRDLVAGAVRKLEQQASVVDEHFWAPLRDRVDFLARQAAEASQGLRDSQDELAIDREKREQDLVTLYGRLGSFQDKVEQQLKRKHNMLDTSIEQLRELIGEEKIVRERGLGLLRESLGDEGLAREAAIRSLKDTCERELEACKVLTHDMRGALTRDQAARDRHSETLKDQLAELRDSIEGRVDGLLGMLHDSAGGMCQSWVRGARESSVLL